MIAASEYISDIRIRREAEALVRKGHSVTVLCEGNSDRIREQELNRVKIHRIKSKSRASWTINNGIYAFSWYNPKVMYKGRSILNTNSFDVIYYHDLHHAKSATLLSDWFDIPVVADLHEMYPQSVESWREGMPLRNKLDLGVLLLPIWRYHRAEKFSVESADGLITVSDELLTHFEQEYMPPCTSEVVQNVPDLRRLDSMTMNTLDIEGDFIISYIGGMTPQRGLETAVRAFKTVVDVIPNSKLLLIGDGQEFYVNKIRSLVNKLDLSESVRFTGWVDFERVPSYYKISDITLCPLTDNPDSRIALPNKLFQSMAFKTPQIVSALPAMSRIINTTGSGTTFEPENSVDLARTIIKLYYSQEMLKEMGENGRNSVESAYNIDNEAAKIESVLESVITKAE